MTNQTPNQKKNPAIAADLPEHARERMAMMQQGGKQSHLFTIDILRSKDTEILRTELA